MIPNEFSIGPFTFEYDPARSEMYISRGEITDGMIDHVSLEDWQAFYEAAMEICKDCGEVTLEDEMHWHKEEVMVDVSNMTEKIYVFKLTADDIKIQEEITLSGVISSKVAKGEYYEDPNIAELQGALELCSTVNAGLTDKLNRIRKVVNSDD